MKVGIYGYGRIGRAVHKLIELRTGHNLEVAWHWDARDPGFAFDDVDAVVNAAPFTANKEALEVAKRLGAAYIDFSEDTAFWRATENVIEPWGKPIVPHCGIAPGVINIVAADAVNRGAELTQMFCGALPARDPGGPLHHSVTWSAAGMAREYVEPSERLMAGEYLDSWPLVYSFKQIPIEGMRFESATTAGGIGSMARTYNTGDIRSIVYRTLRWPGHWQTVAPWVNHPEVIDAMLAAAPKCEEDMVVVAVVADDMVHWQGVIRPKAGLSAIELATASAGCAVLDLMDQYLRWAPEVIRQEHISLSTFRRSVFADIYPRLP